MTTPDQLAANQTNAQRFTGPKTPAGTARVSRNAVQHGIQGHFQLIVGEELAKHQTFHDINTISLGEAVTRQIQSNDVISKLHRYEAHIDRGLYRALHELQRLQATRSGQTVPAPIALDITTDQELPNKPNVTTQDIS